MEIYIFGSLNIDNVYQVKEFVKAGETISSFDFQSYPGGKGLNQAIAAVKAGGHVSFIGTVGQDGRILKDCLARESVSLKYLREAEGVSGHAIIQVNRTGENCIILYPGANILMNKAHIDGVLRTMNRGDIALVQNETNEVPYIISTAHREGMKVVFNPSPISDDIGKYPLDCVDIFVLNEVEGQMLSGRTNAQDVLDVLVGKYPRASFFLTLGRHGSYYRNAKESYFQEIYPAKRVDTTAAGDTYTGFLIASIAEGLTTIQSMQIATMAAAITVSRKGASTSIPHRADVMNRLQHLKATKI